MYWRPEKHENLMQTEGEIVNFLRIFAVVALFSMELSPPQISSWLTLIKSLITCHLLNEVVFISYSSCSALLFIFSIAYIIFQDNLLNIHVYYLLVFLPFECKLPEDRDCLFFFFHWCISSTQNSTWHIVGVQ